MSAADKLEPVDPWDRLLQTPRRGLARAVKLGLDVQRASSEPPPVRPARGLFKFLNWTLRIDLACDRPPALHRYRCAGEYEDGRPCGAEGQLVADFETAQRWPAAHLREHQDHRSYEHVMVTPWVMEPEEEPN
ncbi:DUF7848 domain-containing protein [Kitasatospora sp. NPDC003701]